MSTKKIDRRKFIQLSATAVGITVVACGGLSFVGSKTPPFDFPKKIQEGKMKDKVLVAYASMCGSTAEVAKYIASNLTAKGEVVDLIQARDVVDLKAYKKVVLGSAIRGGSWLDDASSFISRFQAVLNPKTTAYFTLSGNLIDDPDDQQGVVSAYLDPIRAVVKPEKEAFFAGVIDFKKMSFFDAFIMRYIFKSREGDYRKWDEIKNWADGLV